MPDRLHLADLRESLDLVASVRRAQHLHRIHSRNIQLRQLIPALTGRTALEHQRLILIDMLPDFADHRPITSATASRLSRRDISVVHSSIVFPSSG